MRHATVLMGGWSAERDVSLSSGNASANAAEEAGFAVERIDVQQDIADVLAKRRPVVVLNMLHGPFGEDGGIQKILENLRIPYSHSGVLASSLAMDKPRAKAAMASAGVPLAEGKIVSRFDAGAAHALPTPYVLKPVANGSSVGVFIIRNETETLPQELLSDDWKHGDMLLAEKYVTGRELSCGIMGDQPLDVVEIESELPFYTYTAKYVPGASRHTLPAQLPKSVYERVQSAAISAHRALGCRGVSRVDFRYDDASDTLACLEVNTQPGMTATSLVPEMAAHIGISFPELIRWMIEDASLNR